MGIVVEAEGLTKRFNSLTAVEGITFQLQEGEILALLGPNGAGKTTTVRMLASVLAPTAGTARVAGYDVVRQAREVRRSVGLLTEFPALYLRMTADEYLDFFGKLYSVPKGKLEERKTALLEQFGLARDRKRQIGEYSKGMRQKLALVRAMLHDPLVLFLDEPTSAMDPQSAKTVREAIMELRKEKRTALICTHNLSEAQTLADRIAVINRGRIVAIGTMEELRRRYIGAPLMELKLARPMDEAASLVQRFAVVEEKGRDFVRYRTDNPAEVNPLVVKALTEMGAEIVYLQEVPVTLEEVYLRIVA
jgi:ABC-2 type transport system ATP-binding protein